MRFVVPDKDLAVDKMPLNFRFIAEAAILFPDACFVNCTRHPADTFVSALQTEMNAAHSYSYDPADYAAYHREYRRLMAHWDAVLPGRVFHLSYEALVADPDVTMISFTGSTAVGKAAAAKAAAPTPAASSSPKTTTSR